MSIPAALGFRIGMLSGLPAWTGRLDLRLQDMLRSPQLEVSRGRRPRPCKSGNLLNGIVAASTAETPTSPLVRARNPGPCLHPGFERSSSDGSVFVYRDPRPSWIIATDQSLSDISFLR